MMSLDTLLEHLDAGQPLVTGTEAFDCMHGYSYEAMRLTAELNNAFHTPEEIREIMGRITGRPIDETFRLFPPFYTDFGKNIRIGRRVFINACCCFQDQGGISIGDGTLIGHRVTLATITHGLPPDRVMSTTSRPSSSARMSGSVPVLSSCRGCMWAMAPWWRQDLWSVRTFRRVPSWLVSRPGSSKLWSRAPRPAVPLHAGRRPAGRPAGS